VHDDKVLTAAAVEAQAQAQMQLRATPSHAHLKGPSHAHLISCTFKEVQLHFALIGEI
jgi:hypothetical protein